MGVTLSNLKRQAQKKKFFDLDMCWLLKNNSGRNAHTEVQYMVYLSSAPHSYAVLDSATAVSWQKLQKTTSPGTLHGRYPQQSLLWFTTWELSCSLVSLVSRKSQIPNQQTSAQDL